MDTVPTDDPSGTNVRELIGPQPQAALGDRVMAAVLRASDAIDRAIVSGDKTVFLASLAEDCVVNSPANRVAGHSAIATFFERGQISYRSYEKRIEHLSPYGADVLMMGEERYVPNDGTDAPPTVARRFTDLWRCDDGRWVIAIRQATIFRTDVAAG